MIGIRHVREERGTTIVVGTRRRTVFSILLLAGAFACANPEETQRPTPDAGMPDSGVVVQTARGLKLKSSHLAPATGQASSPDHNMAARVGAVGAARATSNGHRLRGGIVAGGANTSSITAN